MQAEEMRTTSEGASISLSVPPAELPARFFRALDCSRYDHLLELLAPECTWLRQGVLLDGKDAIRRAMLERPTDMVVRHLPSSAQIDPGSDGALIIQLVMAAFAGHLAGGELPLTLEMPRQIADYRFVVRQDGDTWLITEIDGRAIFKA